MKSALITVFNDITVEKEIKLRDYYGKVIAPTITIMITKKVKNVRFEYITEGLLFGKVIGKKTYKVEVPPTAFNKIINSEIVTDKVILREYDIVKKRWSKKEIHVNWPTFYFMNPDKIKVKVKELRKKQRKEDWGGKSYKSVFWDWDGAVTLRAVLEFEDGTTAYTDLLRVIFVYKGNASAKLTWANKKRREYKRWVKNAIKYIEVVYSKEVAEVVKQYVHLVLNKPRSMDMEDYIRKLNELREELKELLVTKRAFNYVMKLIGIIIRKRRELTYVSRLMNRASGSNFLIIVEHKKLYNPVLSTVEDEKTKKEIVVVTNEPVRFYTEKKFGHVEYEERWIDKFGNQYFVITSNWEKELESLGFTVKEEVGIYSMHKRFTPTGKKGFLHHEIRSSGIPQHEITVEKEEQCDIEWLWKNVKLRRPRTRITIMFGEKGTSEYIIHVIKPLDRAGRYIVHNYNHREEGKDRVIVHVNIGKQLLFIHRL